MLIDDEKQSIDFLETLLPFFPHIHVVRKFTSIDEAMGRMELLSFDAIFLDIGTCGMQDFSSVQTFMMQFPTAEIIFLAEYPQFALNAFEVNAVDYLLKPVNLERLHQSIQRLEQRLFAKSAIDFVKKPLCIKTMGHFHLVSDGKQEVKWRTRKVKELFLYLWQHRDHPCSRMKILEDLWGDLSEERATALMHTTIYELRKCLKTIGISSPISFINEKYILNVDVYSDLDVLLKAFSSSPATASVVERVLALYKGDYLEEESYHWAIQEQKKVKQLFLRYLQQFLDTTDVSMQSDYLVEVCLDKILQLDPYNEHVVSLLLDYYGGGQKMEKMVRLYDEFKRRWMEDLGLEMPKEVVDIYKQYIMA